MLALTTKVHSIAIFTTHLDVSIKHQIALLHCVRCLLSFNARWLSVVKVTSTTYCVLSPYTVLLAKETVWLCYLKMTLT